MNARTALVVPAGLALGLLVVPLVALLTRVQWASLPATISSAAALSALWLSLWTAALAVLCCLVLGVPLAVVLAQARPRAAMILRAVITLPLVLPPLVGGVALLAVFGRTGLVGGWLESVGLPIAFTPAAIVLAQVFVAMPFLVLTLEGSMRTIGTRFDVVAATLGARPQTVLWRVSLPLARPSLAAGIVLAFTRALGEFGATALVAGNREGVTQTVPMAIYTAFNGAGVGREVALALSFLLVALASVLLLTVPATRQRGAW